MDKDKRIVTVQVLGYGKRRHGRADSPRQGLISNKKKHTRVNTARRVMVVGGGAGVEDSVARATEGDQRQGVADAAAVIFNSTAIFTPTPYSAHRQGLQFGICIRELRFVQITY